MNGLIESTPRRSCFVRRGGLATTIVVYFLSFVLPLAVSSKADERPAVEWISAPQYHVEWQGGDSRMGGASADGRFVVFQTEARLRLDDTDSLWDIYLLDRRKGKLIKITRHRIETAAAGPAISLDGNVVAFHIYPESVLNSLPPRYSAIHLYFRKSGRIRIIDNAVSGEPLNGECLYPALTQKGDKVVFTSNATNISSDVPLPLREVYEYDVRSGALTLLSRNEDGVPANRNSIQPTVDRTGRFIAFLSEATNLNPPLPARSLGRHLYWLDRRTNSLERIDRSEIGWDPDRWMLGKIQMDGRGRFLIVQAYQKSGETAVQWLENSDVFVFDRNRDTFILLSDGEDRHRASDPAISGDGRYGAYVYHGNDEADPGGIVVWRRQTNQKKIILNKECRNPVFSYDGEWIFFESRSSEWSAEAVGDDKKICAVRNPWPS